MQVRLIAITEYLNGDTPEELLEYAGRICYRSKSRGYAGRWLQARIRDGHESLIEHASATFEISGISRACSHQLVRHRISSISQESQRYVDMSNPEWVLPDSIADNPEALSCWNDFSQHVNDTYHRLRELGCKKEDARFCLPNATATRLVLTMNFRSLRHFFSVRCAPDAQWEIREVANQMLWLIHKQAPNVFQDLYEAVGDGR